jgi:hypothetical protein
MAALLTDIQSRPLEHASPPSFSCSAEVEKVRHDIQNPSAGWPLKIFKTIPHTLFQKMQNKRMVKGLRIEYGLKAASGRDFTRKWFPQRPPMGEMITVRFKGANS